MTALDESFPHWFDDALDARSAVIVLGPPVATPDGPSTELHLTVEPSEEDEAADDDQYVWRYGTTEEEAGFGEAEYERGVAATLDEGQRECWAAAIEFLRREGYTEEEIANGV